MIDNLSVGLAGMLLGPLNPLAYAKPKISLALIYRLI